MKKILSIAGIVCFSMLVAVGTHGIYSWFTDQSQRVNSFSVGMNEVEIREEFPDQELTPGKIIKKEAGFTNTGMVPMYVRAVYLFSNKEAEEGSELLMGSTLWEKSDDGYYYYKKVLKQGQGLENGLISRVKFKPNNSEVVDFCDKQVQIAVKVESRQNEF